MILIRFLLISLIVYLIIRAFMKFGGEIEDGNRNEKPENRNKPETKKVSKSIGEYVDFEEVKKNDF